GADAALARVVRVRVRRGTGGVRLTQPAPTGLRHVVAPTRVPPMRIRTLGRSGLRVSEICLGTMTFGAEGWGCDERESLALIDRFLDAGGNFLDTADAYSGNASEEICGKAMHGRRTQFVLATKCTMPVGSGPNDKGASRN